MTARPLPPSAPGLWDVQEHQEAKQQRHDAAGPVEAAGEHVCGNPWALTETVDLSYRATATTCIMLEQQPEQNDTPVAGDLKQLS